MKSNFTNSPKGTSILSMAAIHCTSRQHNARPRTNSDIDLKFESGIASEICSCHDVLLRASPNHDVTFRRTQWLVISDHSFLFGCSDDCRSSGPELKRGVRVCSTPKATAAPTNGHKCNATLIREVRLHCRERISLIGNCWSSSAASSDSYGLFATQDEVHVFKVLSEKWVCSLSSA
jgi:hypothetical protein